MTPINKKLKVVIDSNIILSSVSRKSKFNKIFQKIINKEIELYITNEILTEYKEKLEQVFSPSLSKNTIEILLLANNIHKITPYFKWNLISVDPDDNKFVDCAVASNADFLVTNDKHFDILKEIDFPKVNIIKIDKFMKLLK